MEGGTDQGAFVEELDTVLTAAGDIILLLDANGRIQAVADPGTPTLDYQQEQLIGESVTVLVASDAAGAFDVETKAAFQRAVFDEREDVVVPLAAADGTVVPTSVSVTPRQAGGYLCLAQELDEQRQLPSDTELLDTVADPVYVLDSEDCFTRVNGAMIELTGYDRADLLGRKLAEIVPESSYEQLTTHHAALVDDSDQSETTELTLITDGGELIVTEAHVTVRKTADGEYAGSVGSLRDIRERKQRERTLDLLKQILTRVFRHNVRNELMVAMTHAELLHSQIDSELQPHASQILASAEQLLDHSEKARQIEAVVEHRTQREVNLTATVSELIDTAREKYPEATITSDLPAAWSVRAHPDIDTAVEELIENAIEHAPEDDPQLRLWVDQEEPGETLFLEDESGGLAPEEIQVLRSGREDTLNHGSGVGLWLVRWLVEYSDAELIVHRTGKGTLVGIRFGQQGNQTVDDSPLARTPEDIRGIEPERFHGDTVVGRTETLDQLDEIYDELERTGGHTVLVTGEAGIGKTTLVGQFQEQLADRDDSPLVATGFCNETIQPPYYAFRQILRALPGEENPLARATSSADDIEELAEQKEALFDEVAGQLRAAASDQPVVLIVEDMQWADQGTVALFKHLVDAVGQWSYPVLFVGTYRTSDVDETHPVLEIADETAEAGRGTVLGLEPLDESEVESLLAHMLDIDDVPASFAAEFHEHTGGTPLFVQELGRNLAETVERITAPADLPAKLDGIAVPETVERAIADRLEALPGQVQPTLRLGAVIGMEFSFDVLREASERPVDTLIDAIETLVDRQIWTRSGDGLEFVHGIVREQTLAGIDNETREHLHERVAAAIETVHADGLDEFAAKLGHHYEQIGAYESAFKYYRHAGEYASEQYANEEAITHYERALSLTAEHGVSADETVAAARTELGSIFELVGDYDAAIECYEGSLETSRQIGDREAEAKCLDGLGTIARKQGEFERGREFLEQSSEIRQKIGDREGEAKTLKRIGNIALHQGNYELAERRYKQGLALFREIGDDHGQTKCQHNLGLVAQERGKYSQAREYYQESLTTFRELDEREGELRALNHLGMVAFRQGSYARSDEYLEETLEVTRDIGHQNMRSGVLHNLGINADIQGDYNRAKELFEKSLEMKGEMGDSNGRAIALSDLAVLAIRQGKYGQSREYIDESTEIVEELGIQKRKAINLCHQAMGKLQQNQHRKAHELATDAREIAEAIESSRCHLMSLRLLGAAARKRGAYDEAKEYLTEGLSVGTPEGDHRHRTRVHLELGRLALARSDIESAREAVAQADQIASDLGITHEQGHVAHLRGRIAAASDSPDEATGHWQQALDTFEEIGAPQDALKTLKRLIESCTKQGRDTQEWIEKATEIFENAPDPVQNQHRDWLADHTDEIDQH